MSPVKYKFLSYILDTETCGGNLKVYKRSESDSKGAQHLSRTEEKGEEEFIPWRFWDPLGHSHSQPPPGALARQAHPMLFWEERPLQEFGHKNSKVVVLVVKECVTTLTP